MNTKVPLEEWNDFLDQNLSQLMQTAEEEGLREVEVRVGDKALAIRIGNPVAEVSAPSSEQGEASGIVNDMARVARIQSKHVGIFYRTSQTDSAPVADVGSVLDKDDVLGFVESLQVRHEVTSASGGVLRHFLVEDGQFVQYGQAIAIVDTTDV